MRKPKHLIENEDGETWLERTVHILQRAVPVVAIVGEGTVPPKLKSLVHLPDVNDAKGPVAGILAAMRWAPERSWLVVACDLPGLSCEALEWVLSTRSPDTFAVLPRLPGSVGVEPLLAYYDCRSRELLEDLIREGDYCISRLVRSPRVISPLPPPDLVSAWRNINTNLGEFSQITSVEDFRHLLLSNQRKGHRIGG